MRASTEGARVSVTTRLGKRQMALFHIKCAHQCMHCDDDTTPCDQQQQQQFQQAYMTVYNTLEQLCGSSEMDILKRHLPDASCPENILVGVLQIRLRAQSPAIAPPPDLDELESGEEDINVDFNTPMITMVDELRCWIAECDSSLLSTTTTGESNENHLTVSSVVQYLFRGLSNAHMEYYCHASDRTINHARLSSDLALCEGVCPLHIMHLMAHTQYIGNRAFGSAILSVLAHCLRFHLEHHPHGDNRTLPLLARIMTLGQQSHDDNQSLERVPHWAEALVASMYYSNIAFLQHTRHRGLAVSTENLLGVSGFAELVHTNLFAGHPSLKCDDTDFVQTTLVARDWIINAVNKWLTLCDDESILLSEPLLFMGQ
jgi:hypothetical protein